MRKILGKKKKVKTESASTAERHFGVLLEDMNDKIKLILEGHSVTQKKVDDVHKELKTELAEFKHETHANFKDLFAFRDEMYGFRNDTQANFKSIFEYLSRFEHETKDNFQIVAHELKDIKKEIKLIKTSLAQKADVSRLAELEERVRHLEMMLADLADAKAV